MEEWKKRLGGLPVCVYCAPAPAYEYGGKRYASKITDRQYRRMKELGVNVIFGHDYRESGTRREHEHGLRLASKYGIAYLVKLAIFEEFWSLGGKYPAFSSLNAAQREDLGKRFLLALQEYEKYPAFAGVCFRDEPGAAMFEGIAYAKRLFLQKYPDKLFYVNMFGYWVTGDQMQYSIFSDREVPPKYLEEPKEKRYFNFLRDYMKIVDPQVFSYDLYPMVSLNGCRSVVHTAMYHIFNLIRDDLDKIGKPREIWAFVQAGGKWEGSLLTRVPRYPEIALQINALLAMGAKGIEIFPYCFPDCWTGDKDVEAGLIDVDGEKTDMYGYFLRALRQVRACQDVFVDWTFAGFFLAGEFKGLIPGKEELKCVPDGDCYYTGEIESEYKLQGFAPVREISATSQLLCGCFVREGKFAIYVVNNSISFALNGQIRLQECCDICVVYDGKREVMHTDSVPLDALNAGESVMIIQN